MGLITKWIKYLSRARDLQTTKTLIVSAIEELSGASFVCVLTEEDETAFAVMRAHSEANTTFFNLIPSDIALMPELNIHLSKHKRTTVIPIKDESLIGVILIAWDLSEEAVAQQIDASLILAECALIVLQNVAVHGQLAKQMAERTTHLAAARQEAESANQLQRRFLSAASHDLRQPLQQINSLIDILIRQPQEQHSARQLKRIQHIIGDMNTLLASLLNLERLVKGKIEPQLKTIQIADLIDTLKNDFTLQAAEKGLQLTFELTHDSIISDKGLLLQVLRNLVGNAIKYTFAGGVKITTTKSADFLTISVHDTGQGIAADRQISIFDPFYQIDGPSKLNSGFGLGLSLVKALAETLNHPISLVSEEGSGSVFSVQLPIHKNAIEMLDAQDQDIIQLPEQNQCVVLYLEDDDDLTESISTLLTMEGYQALTASSSIEAKQVMIEAQKTPDIIVTDNSLDAGESGIEVVQQIRNETGTRVPAIMLTGYTENAMHRKALMTVQKVLTKPVDADDLLNEIAIIKQTLI